MVVLLITFVVLLVIGMPVAFVIGLAGVAFFASAPEIPFSIAVQRIVAQTQSYTFLAVPFFIFAGNLMNESGITKRILDFASMLTRRMYGGLAQVSVVMSTMMGGISGSEYSKDTENGKKIGEPHPFFPKPIFDIVHGTSGQIAVRISFPEMNRQSNLGKFGAHS